jgi:hypothetical protein
LSARFALLAIVSLGLGLRMWTIGGGVPHNVEDDEPVIMEKALHMMKSGDLNPHFFDYGGFTIYLHLGVATAKFITGSMNKEWSSLDNVWEGDFYLWTRGATALLGTLLIYVMYRVGLRWGTGVALFTALLVAVHPHLVRLSHFALTDIPLALFVALTLLLSLLATEDGRARWFFAAGATAGLAAATKYSGAVALLTPLAAAALSPTVRFRSAAVMAASSAALGAFLLVSPYSLLDMPAFLNSFGALAQHYNAPRPAMEVADQYLTYTRNGFGFGSGGWNLLGWPAVWLAIAGLIWAVVEARSRLQLSGAAVILVFPIAYFWLISHQSLVFARYALPLVPALCLGIAVALARLRTRIPWRPAYGLALILVAIPPTVQAISFDLSHGKVGTEELVARWLEHNVKPGDRIVVETPRIRLRPEFPSEYTPRLIHESLESYQEHGVKYLVASSEKFAPTTVGNGMPSRDAASYQRLFASTDLVQMIQRGPDHPGPNFTIFKVRPK